MTDPTEPGEGGRQDAQAARRKPLRADALPTPRVTPDASTLAAWIGGQARRKLHAQRLGVPVVWSGLGVMGMVGWSIVVPTLLGVELGGWLDRRHVGGHSWTLALLMAGLVLGCFNAGYWVSKEQRAMRDEEAAGGP